MCPRCLLLFPALVAVTAASAAGCRSAAGGPPPAEATCEDIPGFIGRSPDELPGPYRAALSDSLARQRVAGEYRASDGFTGHTYVLNADGTYTSSTWYDYGETTEGRGRWLATASQVVLLDKVWSGCYLGYAYWTEQVGGEHLLVGTSTDLAEARRERKKVTVGSRVHTVRGSGRVFYRRGSGT